MSLSLSQPSEITVDPQSRIPEQENARSAIYSLTPGLTEGPFYKAGAPFKDQLADNPTMNVTGRVYNVYGDILSGAVLDFWQADEGGVYDVDGYKLRGKVRANDDGRYILKTIRPGNYAVTTKITRSAHIHVKVSIEGYKTLTTQLYFVGDKYSRDDPWFHKNTVLPGAESNGEFNFVIEEEQENSPTVPQEKAVGSANPKEPLQEKPLTKPHTPTPILSEGTFYKEGAPFRNELSEKSTLHISGQVLDVYGSVIEGAIMEFWQADEKGAFDTEGFNLRGQIKSEQEGHYEVKTIRPGNYTDSTNKIRSSQIYVRITAPSYRTLTTQLYFRDDKYNDEDLEFTPSTLIPEDNKFNFILEKLEDIWTSFTQRPTKNQSSSSDGTSLYTPTPSCVEGLFYKEGAPFRNKLSENPNLHFSGRVFNIHGEVVEGAILDFWQNNESGIFDTEGFRLRGKVKVDNKGQYELNTIRPIHYPVTIKITRTAHIHVKVSAPGYKTLTTQLYFAGEKYNETDPWFNPGTVISSDNEFNFVIEKTDN